jgi:hypothetical protein
MQKRAEPWNAEQYATWSALGGECWLCDSAPGSPAWLNDLRAGFWVRSVNDRPLDEFERIGGSIGDVVIVRADVPGVGPVIRSVTLSAPKARTKRPTTTTKRQPAQWTRERSILPGRRVYKRDRPKYLAFAAHHQHVSIYAWFLIGLLEREYKIGIKIRHAKLAEALGRHPSTIKRAQSCCAHFGFLRVLSGKAGHRSNQYEPCFPHDYANQNV